MRPKWAALPHKPAARDFHILSAPIEFASSIGRDEMILSARGLSGGRVDKLELHVDRVRRQRRASHLHRYADFAGLVLPNFDDHFAVGSARDAGDVDGRGWQARHNKREASIGALVQNPQGVVVANTAVRQEDVKRIALMEHVDADGSSGRQRVQQGMPDA